MGSHARALAGLIASSCLVAACSFTSLDPLQSGSTTSSGPAGGANPATSTSSSTGSIAGGGSSSSSSSLGGGGSGGEAGHAGFGGSGAGGAGGGAGGDDVPPPDLANTGLLARYFIDEAASGAASGDLEDVASDPAPLSIQDFDGVMQFVAEDGHRGLGWGEAGIRGVASRGVGTSKFASLNNTVHGTIEVVARVDQVHGYGSRLMHIGTSSESSFTLAISHDEDPEKVPTLAPNRLEMRTRGHGEPAPYRYAFFDFDAPGERVVIHAVYDSQELDEEDRIRMYLNGGEIFRQATDMEQRPGLDEQLFVEDEEGVTIGNRDIGGRSIAGSIFYAAMYRAPLSEAEIAQNVAELLRTDDR